MAKKAAKAPGAGAKPPPKKRGKAAVAAVVTPPDDGAAAVAAAAKGAGKSLVIVESPAKAKTINKILGPKFIVKASYGHVRDLPQRRFGIDVDHDFEPRYTVIKKKEKVLGELKAAAKTAKAVYLASDPDREGEAIAWHLVQALRVPAAKVHRVTFNEITQKGVQEAFKKPGAISMDRVDAQQARRLLDRIVGYKLSPLLWKNIARGLSAGRVQSVAVRLIVEREREIQAFKPVEYWTVTAIVSKHGAKELFKAELTKLDDLEPALSDEKTTKAVVEELQKAAFTIRAVNQKEKLEHPRPPYITSTLQQQAWNTLYFSASRTMKTAQQLYEGIDLGEEGTVGLITYMRTDSFRIADEAVAEVRDTIRRMFGAEYLPETPPVAKKAGKGAQEAHEAIRPTSASHDPESIRRRLTEDQYKLYKLIWRRFVASQMKPAQYLNTDAQIQAGRATLVARGRELKFDGFTRVMGHRLKPDEQILPSLVAGERLDLKEVQPLQHFTEPPPRYSEASLVKTLEKYGIGRPSTYAPTLQTVQDRGYVRSENRQLRPEELGVLVNDKLVAHFDNLVSTGFTADMEKALDEIEEGSRNWVAVLKNFYGSFILDIGKAEQTMESVKGQEPAVPVPCEKCGKPMFVKWNRYGKFLGCSTYPECKSTKPLQSPEAAGENCDTCQAPMVIKAGRFGRFLACSKYPECKSTRPIPRGNRKLVVPKEWSATCEKCNSRMAVKYGRRGAFIACTGYPNCKNTQKVPKEWYVGGAPDAPGTGRAPKERVEPPADWSETCEKCASPMALKKGSTGHFISCTAYPRCRNVKQVPPDWIKVEGAPVVLPPPEAVQPDADED